MPKLVHAQVVKRYRLALIEEPGNRIVARLPEIPVHVVDSVAAELQRLIPFAVAAAQLKTAISTVVAGVPRTRKGAR